MAHERVSGNALPVNNLLFEGATYDLGWDGRRNAAETEDPVLPTADFAMYLINAVKFHCGQLYHLYDEHSFMYHLGKFYEDPDGPREYPLLWYIHYLLILAFGKAVIIRTTWDRRPSGADFFVHAMKILPDISFLYSDPIESIEILCCAALYLQCLDHRSVAYNLVCRPHICHLVPVHANSVTRSARLRE
jgi:hypothetical protein